MDVKEICDTLFDVEYWICHIRDLLTSLSLIDTTNNEISCLPPALICAEELLGQISAKVEILENKLKEENKT